MAPDVLLLILALTSCLTEHVYCEMKEGSGDDKSEASVTDEPVLPTGHTLAVTTLPDVTTSDITVYNQGDQAKNAEAQEQVTLEHADTLMQTKNTTHSKPQNGTTGVKVNAVPAISGNATKNGTKVLRVNGGLSGNTTTRGTRVTSTPSKEEAGGNKEEKEKQTDEEDNWSNFIVIVTVCVIIGLLLMAAVAAGFLIKHRRREKNAANAMEEDPHLDGADSEKVPMPMFEEDVPSVLELEMEDFEKWMIKDGGVSTDSKQQHL